MTITQERQRILKACGILAAAIVAAFLIFFAILRFIGPSTNFPYLVLSVVMPILMFLIVLGPGVVVLLLVFHWARRPSLWMVLLQLLIGLAAATVASAAAFSLLFRRDGPNDYGFVEFVLIQLQTWGWWAFWAGVTLVVLLMVRFTERNRLKRGKVG